jgi:hypothetical protein
MQTTSPPFGARSKPLARKGWTTDPEEADRGRAKPTISDEAAIGDEPESRGDPYTGSAT